MPTSIVPVNIYPTLQDVANFLRTIVNDDGAGATGTVGEGQIIVDDTTVSVKALNAINGALRSVYTEMGNVGDPTLIADNYIVRNLPTINGANGQGSPDAAAQVALTYTGFFDGTQWHSTFKLPANMFQPTRMWQRVTATNLPFAPLPQAQDGLNPGMQGNLLGAWEWREDGVWMNGSIQNCDVRIRSQVKLPVFRGNNLDWTTTHIPMQECTNAVAYRAAEIIEHGLGNPEGAMVMMTKGDKEIFLLKNARVRRNQGVDYNRPAFQEGSGTGLAVGFAW